MRLRHIVAMIAIVQLAPAMARADDGLPLDRVKAIKNATVMIVTGGSEPGDQGSGSGFLIRVTGDTGFIVTNHHVISAGGGDGGHAARINVIVNSGTRDERRVAADVVASSTERDLAVLRIRGVSGLSAPIDVLDEAELVETLPVYIFGFPFGQALGFGRGNPSVVVGKGSISSVRRDLDGHAWRVLIDGALNPGNSGGPVVDSRGRLVGVAVATIRGANIGIAIAPPELTAVLAGQADRVAITGRTTTTGTAELVVDVRLLDPLEQVKGVDFLYARKGASMPVRSSKKSDRAPWQPLAGATTTRLTLDGQRASGLLSIAPDSIRDFDLVHQVALVDRRGQVHFGRPGHFLGSSVVTGERHGGKPGAIVTWVDAEDPDNDCKCHMKDGVLHVEVPGSHHDLNAEIGKFNAPRFLQEVDGDFVVQVKVVGAFEPEGPSTREGALPFHGAGLLIWLDSDHFIRFERGAALRNGKIGAFLLFEEYQPGGLNSRNNGRLDEGDVYLKIERRDQRITGSFSTDGRDWVEARPLTITWPARVKVGLDAVNSAFSQFTVQFEEFSVKRLGAGSR